MGVLSGTPVLLLKFERKTHKKRKPESQQTKGKRKFQLGSKENSLIYWLVYHHS